MAITKIIAGKGSIQAAVAYILNDKKTDNRILTATLNCEPGHEVQQMLDTKARFPGKSDGVQYYHIIQSFRPGEITPKIALEVAKKFAEEYLSGFEVVIGYAHLRSGQRQSVIIGLNRRKIICLKLQMTVENLPLTRGL